MTPVVFSRTRVLVAVIAGLVACAPALDWRELRPAEGTGLSWLMPCKPTSHARQLPLAGAPVRMTLYACTAAAQTWGVSWADVQDPARVTAALAEMRSAAAANLSARSPRALTLSVAGATPNPQAGRAALDGHFPDGRSAQMQLGIVARGTWVVQASVVGERLDAEAADTFLGSLRFAP